MESINILDECCKNKFDIALMTTFNFEINFFERIMLKKLLNKSGLRYISIYVDKKQMDKSLDMGQPRFLGNQYLVNTISTNKSFHPKIILLLSKKKAKLFVGSCNLTKNGIFKNNEIFNTYEFVKEDETRTNLDIIQQAFEILKHIRDVSNDFDKDIWKKCEEYEYLFEETGKNDETYLIDNYKQSILEQVKDIIDENIESIDVAVPYYEKEIDVIDIIRDRLNTKNINLYIQNEKSTFPFDFNKKNKIIDESNMYIFKKFSSKKERSFYHGKVYRFNTNNKSYILYGSANCTKPALALSFVHNGNFECDILEKGEKDEFNYFFEDLEREDEIQEYKSDNRPDSDSKSSDFIFENSILEQEKLITNIIKKSDYKIKSIFVNDIESEFEEDEGKITITTFLENQLWSDLSSKLEIRINDNFNINGWYYNKSMLYYNREKRNTKYIETDIDISNMDVKELTNNVNKLTEFVRHAINEIQSREMDKEQNEMLKDCNENGNEIENEEYEYEVIEQEKALENLKQTINRRNKEREKFYFFTDNLIKTYGIFSDKNHNSGVNLHREGKEKESSKEKCAEILKKESEKKKEALVRQFLETREEKMFKNAFWTFVSEIKKEEADSTKMFKDFNVIFSIYCSILKEYKFKKPLNKSDVIKVFESIIEIIVEKQKNDLGKIDQYEMEIIIGILLIMALDLRKKEKYYFSENKEFINKIIPQYDIVDEKIEVLQEAIDKYYFEIINDKQNIINIKDASKSIEALITNIGENKIKRIIEESYKKYKYEIQNNSKFLLNVSVDKIKPNMAEIFVKKIKEKLLLYDDKISEIEMVMEQQILKGLPKERIKTSLKCAKDGRIIKMDYYNNGDVIGPY